MLGNWFGDENLINLSDFLSYLGSVAINDSNSALGIIESDVAVNLDSQLGYERTSNNPIYNFREREIIILGDEDNDHYKDAEHCAAPYSYWIAHNFETKSPTAIDNIIEFLNYKEGFHEHTYLNYITNSTHSSMCACGVYELEPEAHTMVYEYRNETTHWHTCSYSECSHFIAMPHNFNCENLFDGSHRKTCLDCGYVVVEEHLMNVYIPINVNLHMVCCECGIMGTTESHNVNVFSGRCYMCDMPIMQGIDPVLPPVIGPVPVN